MQRLGMQTGTGKQVVTALFLSIATGIGLAVLAQNALHPEDLPNKAGSITSIRSGADGTDAEESEEEGIERIEMPPETNPDAAEEETMPAKAVDLQGVQGTEGTETDPENVIQVVTSAEGSIQSIRGIKGIDTVMLQNLEAVLRMQEPPPPAENAGGAVRSAAALLTMENDEITEQDEVIDGRDELLEFELEGS